jgi:hypothetical protein
VFRRTWTPAARPRRPQYPCPASAPSRSTPAPCPGSSRPVPPAPASTPRCSAATASSAARCRRHPCHSIPPGRQQVASTPQDALHRAGRPKWPARALICALYRDEIAPSRTKKYTLSQPIAASASIWRSKTWRPTGRMRRDLVRFMGYSRHLADPRRRARHSTTHTRRCFRPWTHCPRRQTRQFLWSPAPPLRWLRLSRAFPRPHHSLRPWLPDPHDPSRVSTPSRWLRYCYCRTPNHPPCSWRLEWRTLRSRCPKMAN